MKKLLILVLLLSISLSGCAVAKDEELVESRVLDGIVYIQIEDQCFITYSNKIGYSGYSGIANIDCDNVWKDIIILEEPYSYD